MNQPVSGKTIGRLSLYRRVLYGLLAEGQRSIFSHQLAALVGGTAAQVRRDISEALGPRASYSMAAGYTGSPTRGYEVQELTDSIGRFLDSPQGQRVALMGVGNLGRALLAYFSGRRPKLEIEAAFDVDPARTRLTVLVDRAGPLARLGHNHAITSGQERGVPR
jgi:redox-sensing transcriptional repressor